MENWPIFGNFLKNTHDDDDNDNDIDDDDNNDDDNDVERFRYATETIWQSTMTISKWT